MDDEIIELKWFDFKKEIELYSNLHQLDSPPVRINIGSRNVFFFLINSAE